MAKGQAAAGFIFVTILLDVLGIGLIIPVLPGMVSDFVGGDPSEGAVYFGPIAAIYAAMQFMCAPLLGGLSDRLGRRPVLLTAQAGLVLAYLATAWAPSLGWLMVARALAGATSATITTANAYLGDISTPQTRAANFGIVGAAFGLGFVFGPALGGVLGGVWTRLPFLAAAGMVSLNILYGVWVLPESLPPEKRVRRPLARLNPLSSILRLRTYPVVFRLAGAFVCIAMAQRCLEMIWVLHAEYRYGWGPVENGLTLAVVGLSIAFVQGVALKRLVARFGERALVLGGLSLGGVVYLGYGAASESWMLLCVIPVGAFSGVAQPTLQGIAASSVPDNEQGSVQGALTSLLSLTAVIAPLVSTGLFRLFTGPDAPVVIPGVSFFVGTVFLWTALLITIRALPKDLGAQRG